jgi:hypothetical protein
MEPSSIIKSLATVGKIVTKLVDVIKESEPRKVAIELQGYIVSLQSDFLSMQSEHYELLKTKNDLEQELINQNWKESLEYKVAMIKLTELLDLIPTTRGLMLLARLLEEYSLYKYEFQKIIKKRIVCS